MKKVTVVTPCFNEQENVEELFIRVQKVFLKLKDITYEHIFIDNASTDKTVDILRTIAIDNHNVKIIINSRNFGHIRSPFHGIRQADGDAVILLVADLQDPPELILEFIRKWESGYKIVVGVKPSSDEYILMSLVRKAYYKLISNLSEVDLIQNFTGFGLYDKKVIDILRNINDGYPYFRGLISEIGFDVAQVPFRQPVRKGGSSKNNIFTLIDIGLLGLTSQSKVPIRLATIGGLFLSGLSLFLAIIFFILKMLFWNSFPMGVAPLLMGLFFFCGVQIFFIGMLGEYILSIHIQSQNRPLVVEKERVNF